MAAETSATAVSIVVPAKDEAENLAELIEEIRSALDGRDYEIVVVDDGSTDDTAAVIAHVAESDRRIRRVFHPCSLGLSAAIHTGVRHARGRLVANLDGDGQNDPAYLPMLLDRLEDPEVGLVAGQRLGRKDSAAKQWASRIANVVRGGLLGDRTRDTGCGLKAFRRDDFLQLPYFETMHRFLPALFYADGWEVAHVDVVDRPRRHGRSHYGNLERLLIGIPDLFGVWWLIRRRRRNPVAAGRRRGAAP